MADQTANVQRPGLTGVAPTYSAVNATDFFTAVPNSSYILHYKCGATPTGAGSFKITDPTTQIPTGSGAAAGFADAVIQNAGMLANAEVKMRISSSDRFRDSNGRVNLVHTGTLTTVTLNILGPFPA